MHQETKHESKEDNSKHENGEKPIPLKEDKDNRGEPSKAAAATNPPLKIQQKPLKDVHLNMKPNTKQNKSERKSEAAWSKPSLLVSVSLSSLSSATRVTIAEKTGSEKKSTEIIKEAVPSLKRKRMSDDETVEKNKLKKIKYVTYHRGHGAQGVPKLVIRRIISDGE